ncbi:MAG: hypothetical protein OXF74_06615 [Rhodobacteraceae bacterium]|nr:hypothetical protein [Paracoccaceae bacterium]
MKREGLSEWNKVVSRFEASDVVLLRDAAELALCLWAEQELKERRPEVALGLLDRALHAEQLGVVERRLHGHLIRAGAHLAAGNGEACAADVQMALSILAELSKLPREVLMRLIELSKDIGLEKMRDLIKSSRADAILRPLITALERELGLEPRVAREVAEIAEDIRKEYFALRNETSSQL